MQRPATTGCPATTARPACPSHRLNARLAAGTTQLAPGDELAGYRVESYVARGGMAVVYRARDVALGRPVALKVIAPELAMNETFRLRFRRESELAAAIEHPNVIPIYRAGGRTAASTSRCVSSTARTSAPCWDDRAGCPWTS